MRKKINGFTLIEMLLVMVIVSTMIYLMTGYLQQKALQMRVDRTTAQMQQILNAGLSFYISNGKWPTQLSDLQPTYLPPGTMTSPFGQPYVIAVVNNPTAAPGQVQSPPIFYVYTSIGTFDASTALAQTISGTLPLAYTSSDGGTPGTAPPDPSKPCKNGGVCSVVSSVNIPGQNLNNARAINFAGIFHHGGCVPVPQCPVDVSGHPMKPELHLVPVQLMGVNDYTPYGSKPNVYPISSFTTYFKSPASTPDACNDLNDDVVPCNATPPSNKYWRACVQIVTTHDDVSKTNSTTGKDAWGRFVTLLALTRCAVDTEPAGSAWSVYSS